MLPRKGPHTLSMLEAVDHLSQMAEVDAAPKEGKKKGAQPLTEEQRAEQMHALSWHNAEYYAFHQDKIKETFEALLQHMKDVYEKGKGHLREDLTQRGFQAMMLLVNEAVQKIDTYTEVFKGDKEAPSILELKAFKELQQFYHTKVFQRFQKIIEFEEPWQEEWGGAEEIRAPAVVLKDLDTVRRDQEYELFQICQEDGTAYFNRTLVRHMQLIGQLGALLADVSKDSPLQNIQALLDKEAHLAAKEILHAVRPSMDLFYAEALKFKHIPFVTAIHKGLMALMLAANSRNLMASATDKYALNYYTDFHTYLREALTSPEYAKCVSRSSPSDHFLYSVMHLAHALCTSFFLKSGSRRGMLDCIHMLIEKGKEKSILEPQVSNPLRVWDHLHDQDASIRSLLRRYPNGPLMKTLSLFQNDEQMRGFDPMAQLNNPSQLYTLSSGEMHVSCIQVPSPTVQVNLVHAEVAPEFSSFIRSLSAPQRNQRHLLINLQDRTSWLSHARCVTLEEMQQADFASSSLQVVTLPKTTEFYLQSGSYKQWDDATEFKKLLQSQVEGGEQCGFYFPPQIDQKQLLKFTREAIQVIHTVFFADKQRLEVKNRQDFIEIFYQMLTLKLIEEFKPDTLSFTCKDGVDVGPVASAELFAFLRMMNDPSSFTKQEQDFLLWMLYAPALGMRERAIASEGLNRMLSALATAHAEVEAHFTQTVAACAKLYKTPFFQGVTLSLT